MDTIIAVDPGLDCGLVVMAYDKKCLMVIDHICIIHRKKKNDATGINRDIDHWVTRAKSTLLIVQTYITTHRPKVLICEQPEMFFSGKGIVTAASGSLNKLSFMVGAIWSVCMDEDVAFYHAPVTKWKGQLPKDVTIDRIKLLYDAAGMPYPKLKSHEWDALGIALWWKGLF